MRAFKSKRMTRQTASSDCFSNSGFWLRIRLDIPDPRLGSSARPASFSSFSLFLPPDSLWRCQACFSRPVAEIGFSSARMSDTFLSASPAFIRKRLSSARPSPPGPVEIFASSAASFFFNTHERSLSPNERSGRQRASQSVFLMAASLSDSGGEGSVLDYILPVALLFLYSVRPWFRPRPQAPLLLFISLGLNSPVLP